MKQNEIKICCELLVDSLNENSIKVWWDGEDEIFRFVFEKPSGSVLCLNFCPHCGKNFGGGNDQTSR